jgi:hypothetical protein
MYSHSGYELFPSAYTYTTDQLDIMYDFWICLTPNSLQTLFFVMRLGFTVPWCPSRFTTAYPFKVQTAECLIILPVKFFQTELDINMQKHTFWSICTGSLQSHHPVHLMLNRFGGFAVKLVNNLMQFAVFLSQFCNTITIHCSSLQFV